MQQSIKEHEGKKYLRNIHSAVNGDNIQVDVYAVLEAFNVTCPAIAHAVKKLLACGQRGKGDIDADLKGVLAAVNRAIDLNRLRTKIERGELES
jgi:cell division protein ZapA (FtsZ GTPase activity inhibitor)